MYCERKYPLFVSIGRTRYANARASTMQGPCPHRAARASTMHRTNSIKSLDLALLIDPTLRSVRGCIRIREVAAISAIPELHRLSCSSEASAGHHLITRPLHGKERFFESGPADCNLLWWLHLLNFRCVRLPFPPFRSPLLERLF